MSSCHPFIEKVHCEVQGLDEGGAMYKTVLQTAAGRTTSSASVQQMAGAVRPHHGRAASTGIKQKAPFHGFGERSRRRPAYIVLITGRQVNNTTNKLLEIGNLTSVVWAIHRREARSPLVPISLLARSVAGGQLSVCPSHAPASPLRTGPRRRCQPNITEQIQIG